VCIDPQNDFMDLANSALPVPGANADMDRLADFIRKHGRRLEDIHVTMDSHQEVDIAHPTWWVDAKGKNPEPMSTIISINDIKAGIWNTRDPKQHDRALAYVESLAKGGKYLLQIWPAHCRIGTWGHSIQVNLMDALLEWQKSQYAMVDFVTKGTNPYTEHYGALMAEVPDPNDPSTQLNTGLIETLAKADVILIAGEALSHCVKETLTQIVENIGDEHVKKIKILTDCTSSIPDLTGIGGPNFPAIADAWLQGMMSRGVETTTSTTFFN
jgi:nicotinamidase-related amidase